MNIYNEQDLNDQADALADQEDADTDEVWGEDEISNEEKNACDHYNERYVYPDWRD